MTFSLQEFVLRIMDQNLQQHRTWQYEPCSERAYICFVFSAGCHNVFPVSKSVCVMKKINHSYRALVGRGHKREKGAGEKAKMLPKAKEREKQETKLVEKLKSLVGNVVETVPNGQKAAVKKDKSKNEAEKLLEMETNRKEEEREMPAEEIICGFIEQGNFSQACCHISHLEQSGNGDVGNSESLYTLLAERMWSAVRKALGGSDGMLLQPLQSVGESLQWQKQKKEERLSSKQGMEPASTWHPNFWEKDLEKELTQYWTAQISPFIPTGDADESALKQHLSQLETTFLLNLEHRSGAFKEAGLLIPYTRCCHASLSSHLSALTDSEHCTFSQGLLVYEWCLEAYKRGSGTQLGPRQSFQHSDVQSLMWIILKTEEKLLAVAREVGKALNEAFDTGETPCADAAIIQILTEKTKAAQHISESLREKVEAVCLEEYLTFLNSYENKVRSFLQHDCFHEISSSLRIIENFCILRNVWYKLTYLCSASTDQDVKIKRIIDRTEDDIMEHFLQTVTSEVKGTLKDHFRKSDSGFRRTLEVLKQSFLVFKRKKTDKYQDLVKSVNNIITKEYVQAFLATCRKLSVKRRWQMVSKMEEDHRMLYTIFKECLGPTAGALKDPIQAILTLIQAPDAEGMKIALLPIPSEFPDLREEHLNAVLDIKEPLRREDRDALLKIFRDNCRKTETENNLLFEDIEVKPGMYKCCCFCC
ncbi:exocyst complex component 3-like isoform X2 [Coturnix japonica]|uniref:exocyst complex component 3-like isoform X2 n=1 Tax=Coturnix japonica TaxID=93934 RepID=UPI000777550C|nr:exocyst complex component 3-like isoform X2 [Coturnix japonica]